LAELARHHPLSFYSIPELACRARRFTWKTVGYFQGLLMLPDLLVGDRDSVLLSSWQYQKAYVSAFASWIKAFIMAVVTPSAMTASVGAGMERSGDEPVRCLGRLQLWLLDQMEHQRTVQTGEKRGPRIGPWYLWRYAESVDAKPIAINLQLVLLLWLAKAVAAVIQQALKEKGAGGPSNISSSSSSGASGSSTGGGFSELEAYAQAMEACDRRLRPGEAYSEVTLCPLAKVPVVLGLIFLHSLLHWQRVAIAATAGHGGDASGESGAGGGVLGLGTVLR
jgi:hypothetical protein